MYGFKLEPGRPIYNMQSFLRVIGQVYQNFRAPIPDGIFGVQTEEAVMSFQKDNGMAVTGEVNNETWDKIIEVYREALIYARPALPTSLFPSGSHVIRQGDRASFHYPIQAVIYTIAKNFDNIDDFVISDTHEGGVVDTVKQLQLLFGDDCNGNIDAKCWKNISRVYENIMLQEVSNAPDTGNTEPSKKDTEMEEAAPNRFVELEELNNDIRRERGMGEGSHREGVFTPRLAPYSALGNESADENVTGMEEGTSNAGISGGTEQMPEKAGNINSNENNSSANEMPTERSGENERMTEKTDMTNHTNTVPENNTSGGHGVIKKEPLRWKFY